LKPTTVLTGSVSARDGVKTFAAGSKWDPESYDLENMVNSFGVLPYKSARASGRYGAGGHSWVVF
jgi:hypothetical protein